MENVLTLQGFGARLRIKDGLFEVTVPDMTGAGNNVVEEFAAQTINTILMHQHTSISADAMLLANRHEVQVIVLDEHEFPSTYLANLRKPPNIHIWKSQILLHQTVQGLNYARQWICQKIRRQLEWLVKLKGYRTEEAKQRITATENYLKESFARISKLEILNFHQSAATLRGIEGNTQRQYLQLLSQLMPDHLRFSGRSQQPASDVFNAALNYGYGILYNWVEKSLWENGLNPYFGFLHNHDRHQKSLLFDFIEPYRPWMDKTVFNLCVRKELSKQHTLERKDGGIWLNKEGKEIVADASYNRFLTKKVVHNEKKWSLRQFIHLEANQLAMALVKDEKAEIFSN